MPTGSCKWFSQQKGFGFLMPDAGGKDVFIHITALKEAGLDDLEEGQRVSYELAHHEGRTLARDVRVID